MSDNRELRSQLEAINAKAEFNRWCGVEVVSAAPGVVELGMPWRKEAGQYSGFLHAGATLVGVAAHCSVNCLRPAVGERFITRAKVVRAGKQQVFTSCELFAVAGGEEKLVATGETLLTVVKPNEPGG